MDGWVECRSDYEYAGRPLAFGWQGRRLEVREVLAQWRTPDEKGFRIQTVDEQIFELVYQVALDRWVIHPA